MLRNSFIIIVLLFVLAGCALHRDNVIEIQELGINTQDRELVSQTEHALEKFDLRKAESLIARLKDINNQKQSTYLKEEIERLEELFEESKIISGIASDVAKHEHEDIFPERNSDKKEVYGDYTIPLRMNKKVADHIKVYCGKRKYKIAATLKRSYRYVEIYKRIFKKNGLPWELAYLPVIESGFLNNARSRASAVGVWQFMSFTARLCGLKVNWYIDERRDPIKSAKAASYYLKGLYQTFGDWYLALAAYNGGPGRVSRAIKRGKSKDFFVLASSRRYLKRETRNYVPGFLAVLYIVKDLKKYGFEKEKTGFDLLYTDYIKELKIPSPVSLKEIAKKTNLTLAEIKGYNPELINSFTPFNMKSYKIKLPINIKPEQLKGLKILPKKKLYFRGWYKVRKGDNLYKIARRFKTTVYKIKKTNNLRSNMIKPGKKLLIPKR